MGSKFFVGAEFAGVVILEKISGDSWNRYALYRAKCNECGAITDILGSSLQHRVSREVTGCAVCRNQHSHRGTRLTMRLRRRSNRSKAGGMIKCKTCCDVPTRRPLDRPCACGEHYQQETIAFHADGHRGTASAHGVSFEPIDRITRERFVNGIWKGQQSEPHQI